MSSEIIFTEPIDVSSTPPSSLSAQTGTQFSDVSNTFNIAGSPNTEASISEQIQQFLGYHPNPLGEAVGNAGAQIGDFFSNLFRFGDVSGPTDSGTQTTRVSNSFPVKAVAISSAIGATAIGGTIIATNPGVQKTTQSFSKPLQTLADAANTTAKTTQSILTSKYGPLLLIGGLALAAILVIKK